MPKEIMINDENWMRLQALARPLEDTVDDVLGRLLDSYQKPIPIRTEARSSVRDSEVVPSQRAQNTPVAKRQRLARGERLPVHGFKRPILNALNEIGGEGRPRDILPLIERRLKDQLADIDYARLGSGTIRWEKTAHFARLELCEAGLIDASTYGVWKLTSTGRKEIGIER